MDSFGWPLHPLRRRPDIINQIDAWGALRLAGFTLYERVYCSGYLHIWYYSYPMTQIVFGPSGLIANKGVYLSEDSDVSADAFQKMKELVLKVFDDKRLQNGCVVVTSCPISTCVQNHDQWNC